MALYGAISSRSALRLVVTMLHDHDPVVMRMEVMMPAMAVLYDNGFGARNRRRRNGDRSERGNDASKFLHCVLLLT